MHTNGTKLYSARIIPFKGSWIEFATDINNVMYAYIDRKKKLPVTKLLLADEPTGALDSASGAQVMELFHQLHENGATIIMITHDAQVAQQAQRIMTIRDGVLSGGDNHEQ